MVNNPANRSIKSRLRSGSAWAFSSKMLAAATGFAVNALLARLLTPEELGAYFLTFSIVTFAALIAQLGMKQAVVRLVAEALSDESPGNAKKIIGLVFIIVTIGTVFVSTGYYYFAGRWIGEEIFEMPLMVTITGLAAIWIAIWTYQTILAETFRGLHDIRYASIFGGLSTSIISAVLFAVLWFLQGHADLTQVVTLAIASGVSSVLIASAILGFRLNSIKEKGDNVLDAHIADVALPLYLTGLLLFVISEGHIWVLGAFRPESEVAVYGAASRLVNLVAMPLLIINSVLPPMVSELYTRREFFRVENVLRGTATIAGVPSFLVLVLFVLLGEYILGVVFGEYYMQGFPILAVMAVGKIVNVFTGSPGVLMIMAGRQKALFSITAISGIFGMVTSLVLVEPFGGTGVAAGVSVGLILHNTLMWIYCMRKLNIRTHMGIASLSDFYNRGRRKLSIKQRDGGIWLKIERVVRVFENFIWKMRGYTVFDCFGDSHTAIFRQLNGCK